MNRFVNNDFTERIRLKPEKYDWIRENKDPKGSAAGFLDKILEEHIKKKQNERTFKTKSK